MFDSNGLLCLNKNENKLWCSGRFPKLLVHDILGLASAGILIPAQL